MNERAPRLIFVSPQVPVAGHHPALQEDALGAGAAARDPRLHRRGAHLRHRYGHD